MENPKENIVDKIYKLRKNFVIIGLTGRTGSGCTTVAKILQTQHPEEFKTEYGEDLVFDVKKQYDSLINRLIEE